MKREKRTEKHFYGKLFLSTFYLSAFTSVSYTHLDVYKRQIVNLVGKYGKESPKPVEEFVSSLRNALDEGNA